MKIIIQLDTAKEIYLLNKKICETYPEKIAKHVLSKIIFKNNDIIEFISMRKECVAGKRADVAIGPDAEYITFSSRYDKRIWDFNDLWDYLEEM